MSSNASRRHPWECAWSQLSSVIVIVIVDDDEDDDDDRPCHCRCCCNITR